MLASAARPLPLPSMIACRTPASGARSSNATLPSSRPTPSCFHKSGRSTITGCARIFRYNSINVLPSAALSPVSNARSNGQSASMVPPARLMARRASSSALAFARFCRILADPDIRQQAEKRAAPIGPAPGVRVVQTPIAFLGQALVHVPQHVAPHLRGGQVADVHPRDRLHVGGGALFDPVMAARHRRKCEVYHFVRQHPVPIQILNRRAAAHRDAAPHAVVAVACPMRDAPPASREDPHAGARHWKPSVIRAHRPRRLAYPTEQRRLRQIEMFRFE